MSALYRTDDLRRIEREHAQSLSAGTLMERAGQAAARWLDARAAGRASSFIVLCGPGNNGGDGYVCARALRRMGHACICWAPLAATSDDARQAQSAWTASGGESIAELPESRHFDTIVDAMFGIGLGRALDGSYLRAARWAHESGVECIALDVPSGLDADRGTWVGGVAGVRAAATVTFLGDKPGLHTGDGCDAAGAVRIESLGVEAGASAGRLNGPASFDMLLKPRDRNSHKGQYGNLAVIGGDVGMTGAALLAGRAALRLGAGRVYVCCVGAPELRVDPVCPELMMRTVDRLPPTQVAVVGCGLGTSPVSAQALRLALGLQTPVVLDADALNLIASETTLRQALTARSAVSVLTPHPAEAARLLGMSPERVQADRIAAAHELARRLGATIVLKGAGTVVVEPAADGPLYWINPTGGPALATAGTGDVLSGMIGALIAQGFESGHATLAAVWLHGRAAQVHGADVGLLASDVAPLAAAEWARLKSPTGGKLHWPP